MRILILSAEVWRDDTNGGNVLSNIIGGLDAEIAQIYCNPGSPDNNVCKRYFQMTDKMVIKSFFTRKPIGRELVFENYPVNTDEEIAEQPNKKWYAFFHRFRLGVFYAIRNFLWNNSNWKNKKLTKFIDEFKPDVIFAPCYGSKFMLRLTRFVAEYTGKKVISYISDDSYTLKQFRFSPFFWLNRFSVRRQLRKTFPYKSLVYTMTDIQLRQCEKDFGANMKILRKCADASLVADKEKVGEPIRLVYAGGIYLNRYKTLARIADAIRKINSDGVKMKLDIYTGNEITKKIKRLLDDGVNSELHPSVSLVELKRIYEASDIALHVESFSLKNRLEVRMSFSTKIVDCLSSGAATMAVCDSLQGGYAYLKANECAICVDDLKDVEKTLRDLVDNPERIIEYARLAKECVIKNHSKAETDEMILADFTSCL